MSSGLYLYCTELCAVCIHSHSVSSWSEKKIQRSCILAALSAKCRFLIISQISLQSHAVQNHAFQISQHGEPLPACTSKKLVFPLISSNVGIHFLEHCGKHFTYLNQSHTVKLHISSNLTVTVAPSISNFQCWDRFDLTLTVPIFQFVSTGSFFHRSFPGPASASSETQNL